MNKIWLKLRVRVCECFSPLISSHLWQASRRSQTSTGPQERSWLEERFEVQLVNKNIYRVNKITNQWVRAAKKVIWPDVRTRLRFHLSVQRYKDCTLHWFPALEIRGRVYKCVENANLVSTEQLEIHLPAPDFFKKIPIFRVKTQFPETRTTGLTMCFIQNFSVDTT